MYKNVWTEENIQFLKDNYFTKLSSEIANILGIHKSYVNRMASKLGLKRRSNFHKINDEKKRKIVMMYNNGKNSYSSIADKLKLSVCSIIKVVNEYRIHHPELKPSTAEENSKKISEARKNLLKSERARAVFGLEQKSNVNIYRCKDKKYRMRHSMRTKGYEIDYGSNEVYIVEGTKRDKTLEEKASKEGLTIYVPVGEEEGYIDYEELKFNN